MKIGDSNYNENYLMAHATVAAKIIREALSQTIP